MNRVLAACCLTAVSATFAAAQIQDADYLEIFIAHVKPEKRALFDRVNHSIAEANRKGKGDTWMAAEVQYGLSNTI